MEGYQTATIEKIKLKNYRSINAPIEIIFPGKTPMIFVGENNAGKSNIIKAINIILGEFWPGSYEPEDHEFYGRDCSNDIEIKVYFSSCDLYGGRYAVIRWFCDLKNEIHPITFLGNYSEDSQGKYINNNDRDSCICILVDADRSLDYHLSYKSKWTFLSRLMHRFHRALMERDETKQELERLFQETKEKFREVEEFSDFENSLQNDFDDLVASMTHRLQVDFQAYNPVNFFHALRLQAAEGNSIRTIEELGTGEEQILAIAFAHAYAKAFHGEILLIIEEPEAHLHPLAQRWLATKIREMANDGLQIVITTHSPAFLDILGLDGIVLVRKENGSTRVKQISAKQLAEFCIQKGANPARTDASTILPFYSNSATTDILEGLFAKKVVLVEGTTESMSLPIYLSKVGLNVTKEGIALIPVLGKGNLAKWWRFFKIYEIPTYIIFDNDMTDDKQCKKRIDALKSIGIPGIQIDQLLTQESWIIEDHFALFGKDFETVLRSHFQDYKQIEEEAKSKIGDSSKPLVARYVAEHLGKSSETGWSKITELKIKLGNIK